MDEQNVTPIEDEQVHEDSVAEPEEVETDEFKEKVQDVVEKIRTQALLIGARSMTLTIANMIDSAMNAPGKRTMADMKRIIKKVRDFCQKAIDRPVEEPKFGTETKEGTDA